MRRCGGNNNRARRNHTYEEKYYYMLCLSARQSFQRFKEKERFFNMVKKFNVNKSTMVFKNNIVK